MKVGYLFVLFFACFSITAQENKCMKDINAQIWDNFTKSFETYDHKLFGSLHANNFVRASGSSKSLKNKKVYIEGYANRWQKPGSAQTISFRFLERFCDDKNASERGIYRLTINPNSDNERSFYGKFHVVLINNGDWQFLFDYDSSEGNTINKDSYNSAFAIDDFEKY